MKVLVTGAGGQVGSEVHGHLSHHRLLALSRAELDIADRDAVEQCLGAFLPEAVVNCAAWTDVDGCEGDPERAFVANALAVRHLAVACARVGAHLVHVSTDYVFAGDKDGPYHEWDAPAPVSVYGRSKLGGELEIARHAPSWAVARTSWVFGRRGRNFVDSILARAREGAPLKVVTDQVGCPTYAPDLAGALARLAVEHRRGLYHVTNQGACTWHELARATLELAGLDPDVVGEMTTLELGRPAPRPANSVLENLAWRRSGLTPLRPWREALAERIAQMAAVPEGAA
jgi:dTDP-4-dehydrorhamnose reductase